MTAWLMAASVLLAQGAAARKTAREIVKAFGREAVERAEPRIARILEAYGDDAARALRRAGPAGVEAIERFGTPALRILDQWGDDGARLLALEGDRAIRLAAEFGDDAAAFMIRHPGAGREFLERFGGVGLRGALSTRSVATLNRLAGPIRRSGRAPEILGVVERFGDRACAFLWRNKGTVFTGALLAAFLADPEPYLDGVRRLAVEPMREAARDVAARTDWTFVFTAALSLAVAGLGCLLAIRRLRARGALRAP